jgi:uncharacterized membrane protein YedE/YeeE
VGVLVICVLVFTLLCIVCTVIFCIVSFTYIYSYWFFLYLCKDYCRRVTNQLQLVVVVIIIINTTVYLVLNFSISLVLCPNGLFNKPANS